jgi:hypothetical protein
MDSRIGLREGWRGGCNAKIAPSPMRLGGSGCPGLAVGKLAPFRPTRPSIYALIHTPLLNLLLAALFLLSIPVLRAAPEPLPSRRPARTNLAPGLHFNARTNRVPGFVRPGVRPNALANTKTNALAAPQSTGAKLLSSSLETFHRLRASRAFYPALALLAVVLGGCVALWVRARKSRAKAKQAAPQVVQPLPSKLAGKAGKRKAGVVHGCNVLEVGAQARQVWQFDARGNTFVLGREQTCLEGEALPGRLVAKDWRSLFQRKLNIAWLPSEHVFLRVAQFPRSDFGETLAMVELQLEKLSPIPVTQIAWTCQSLPHAEGNLQTVIVIIVARNVVEEFLGKLEAQGYLADRLELPQLDQLQTTAITEDGAWIYPEAAGGRNSALVAWWYGGVLRNLDLLRLPAASAERPAALKEQLMQMAWAGELEGWLAAPPEWHLVADVATSEWEPALRAGLEQSIEVIAPLPTRDLAALTARRAAQSDPRAGLLPIDYALRYQQQFVDRLWMRGLMAVGALYLIGVAVYMVVLQFATYRTHNVEEQVAMLGPTYTNAIQLRDRYKVLKDRDELKYAGLECWNTTARLLPENATLDGMNFSGGKRLTLNGTAPSGSLKALLDFEAAMRKATVDGQELFDSKTGEGVQWRDQGNSGTWTLTLDLKRGELQ